MENKPAEQQRIDKVTVYKVAGEDVTLSHQIVRNYLTKGNGNVTDQDLVQFISICKYNQLNPFLNEAYLVKFGDKPAQMIVSKEALMKRAEGCKEYRGYKAGVIVLRNGEQTELEGTFYLPGDQLVGGWANVYRSDREYPAVSKVRIQEYDKQQSSWRSMPGTMISKVAKVQALREAFPAQLGAMYTEEEVNAISGSHEPRKKSSEVINQEEPDISEAEEIKESDNSQPEKINL